MKVPLAADAYSKAILLPKLKALNFAHNYEVTWFT